MPTGGKPRGVTSGSCVGLLRTQAGYFCIFVVLLDLVVVSLPLRLRLGPGALAGVAHHAIPQYL